jgi:hypothetical protein
VRAHLPSWSLWACLSLGAAAIFAASFAACEETTPGGTGGQGGGGGQGGCPNDIEAQFTVHLSVPGGTIPPDTRVKVTWSAGEEPIFVLEDPETYLTLEDGSNLVCDVDEATSAPTDLPELICHLWTSGPTRIEVTADGYIPLDETLVPPELLEGCDKPIPTDADLELELDLDAGADG